MHLSDLKNLHVGELVEIEGRLGVKLLTWGNS